MIKVGDLVRYDPAMFRTPTLSEKQSRPFGGYGWLADYGDGSEKEWLGIIVKVDENMWKGYGGLGYEVLWSHGYKEKVYSFEIEKVVDKNKEL